MGYRVVKFVKQRIDIQDNSETGIHLGHFDSVYKSLIEITNDMVKNEPFVEYRIFHGNLTDKSEVYTSFPQVLKELKKIEAE